MHRLAISGTRHWYRDKDLYKEMAKLTPGGLILILGDANGIDTQARNYARTNGIDFITCHALWDAYGKQAGPRRNSLMIFFADELWAFPAHDSVGTFHAIERAKKKEIPVNVFPDPTKKLTKSALP